MNGAMLLRAAAAGALALLLAACGVQHTYNAQLRLLNASGEFGNVDLLIDDTIRAGDVAYRAVSAYTDFEHGNKTRTVRVRRAGQSLDVLETTATFADKGKYTAVFYGVEGAPHVGLLDDRETAPDAGKIKLRVFNAAAGAGSVDVYLLAPGTVPAGQTPAQAGVAYGSVTSFRTMDAGAFEIHVTTAGDSTELRLQLGARDFASREVVTVIVLPSASGLLLNAAVLPQAGAPEFMAGALARVRMAFAAAAGETANATLGGQALGASLGHGAVTAYRQVPAGDAALALTLSNGLGDGRTLTLAQATDYTLLAASDGTALQLRLIEDDNRLAVSSSRLKLRMVNLATAGAADLLANYEVLSADTAFLAASAAAQLSAGQYDLTVQAASGGTPLAALTNVSLSAQAVYSLFAFGNGGNASLVLRKDR